MSALQPQVSAKGSFITKLNQLFTWPPSARTASSANVASGGVPGANGQYDYDGSKWVKGTYVIDKAPNWKLTNGALTYYVATATESPWEATWGLGTDGIAPSPTVTEVIL